MTPQRTRIAAGVLVVGSPENRPTTWAIEPGMLEAVQLAVPFLLVACVASPPDPLEDPAPETAPPEATSGEALSPPPPPPLTSEPGALACSEDLGEAEEASAVGHACMMVCAALLAAGCVAVTALCLDAEVLTVGAVTVPCVWAVGAACGGAVGGSAACALTCPVG
jgi:hypothetical protein